MTSSVNDRTHRRVFQVTASFRDGERAYCAKWLYRCSLQALEREVHELLREHGVDPASVPWSFEQQDAMPDSLVLDTASPLIGVSAREIGSLEDLDAIDLH